MGASNAMQQMLKRMSMSHQNPTLEEMLADAAESAAAREQIERSFLAARTDPKPDLVGLLGCYHVFCNPGDGEIARIPKRSADPSNPDLQRVLQINSVKEKVKDYLGIPLSGETPHHVSYLDPTTIANARNDLDRLSQSESTLARALYSAGSYLLGCKSRLSQTQLTLAHALRWLEPYTGRHDKGPIKNLRNLEIAFNAWFRQDINDFKSLCSKSSEEFNRTIDYVRIVVALIVYGAELFQCKTLNQIYRPHDGKRLQEDTSDMFNIHEYYPMGQWLETIFSLGTNQYYRKPSDLNIKFFTPDEAKAAMTIVRDAELREYLEKRVMTSLFSESRSSSSRAPRPDPRVAISWLK